MLFAIASKAAALENGFVQLKMTCVWMLALSICAWHVSAWTLLIKSICGSCEIVEIVQKS